MQGRRRLMAAVLALSALLGAAVLSGQGTTIIGGVGWVLDAVGIRFDRPVGIGTSPVAGYPLLIQGGAGTASQFKVDKAGSTTVGNLYSNGVIRLPGAGALFWMNRSIVRSPVDGQITLSNQAENDFSSLMFGGTTNAFPALKRNTANIEVRLADDSGKTGLIADNVRLDNTLLVGVNPASTGAIRLANNTGIYWRNAANNANIFGIYLNNNDQMTIGGTGTTGLFIQSGVTPATTGTRFLCISTTGQITSSATACSGT